MKKKAASVLLSAALCLLLVFPAAAETRQGVIFLEGMEETVEEALFESPQGFSFWYAKDRLEAYYEGAGSMDGVRVGALYADDSMVLSMIPEEDAAEYAQELGVNIRKQSASSRVQMDVYRELENGRYYFLTLIAEDGRYLRAVGDYSQEAAEGNAKFFQRVLDSVTWLSEETAAFLRALPGEWAEEYEGVGATLDLDENGRAFLNCYSADGSFDYLCEGEWEYVSLPDYSGKLTLRFTSTDNPLYEGSEYRVECVYPVYTESWVESDTLITYLLLDPPVSSSGVSPFEEVFGDGGVSLYREQGPNMRVIKCKEYVSLRETRSTSSKRLAKVPLGALVLAFPEYGEENGFIYCCYHDEYGYILSEYLKGLE